MHCDVIRIARRSPHQRYKTGALIIAGHGVYTGWAHYGIRLSETYSVHAELHALQRARHVDLSGATIYIATVRCKSDRIVLSKPCAVCAAALHAAGVTNIYYAVGSTADDPKFKLLNVHDSLKVYKKPNATCR